ncbi:MAG: 50S ribosomal protein L3 [Thaumarchaeota archaeon]|nr:50S ribosomal protein L3 [Candidatus Calditenuaceae archaeon]MDW8187195.1 50S ribosomal protein L3 [Nitrososphaerota archaeon]
MGHRKWSAPRRGSLAYSPRRRAKDLLPTIDYWPKWSDKPKLLGLVGYKAGSLTVRYVDDVPGSLTKGTEVACQATVVAVPANYVIGAKLLKPDSSGEPQETQRIIARGLPPFFDRLRGVRAGAGDVSQFERDLPRATELRAIVASVPKEAGLEQKRPFVLEVGVSGSPEEAYRFLKDLMGQKVGVESVFSPGQFVDVLGVTKGHGFTGVVARHGIKVLPRKQRKTRRAVGAIGGRKPTYVTRFVPRAGQYGFHERTEFNKRIMAVLPDGSPLTPKGGFPHFTVLRSPAVVLLGSVMGPPKRPVVLREPAKPPSYRLGAPKLTSILFSDQLIEVTAA